MALGSLDQLRFPTDNRVYGKNKPFAIASSGHSPGACLRTCSGGMRRRVSRFQYPTSATDNRRVGSIAFHFKFWQCNGWQQFVVEGNTLGFDRRRDGLIGIVERFRIFSQRNQLPGECAGRSKRPVHGDFHSTLSRELAGQHFFCQQCVRLLLKTIIQRLRNADNIST